MVTGFGIFFLSEQKKSCMFAEAPQDTHASPKCHKNNKHANTKRLNTTENATSVKVKQLVKWLRETIKFVRGFFPLAIRLLLMILIMYIIHMRVYGEKSSKYKSFLEDCITLAWRSIRFALIEYTVHPFHTGFHNIQTPFHFTACTLASVDLSSVLPMPPVLRIYTKNGFLKQKIKKKPNICST